MSPHTGLPSITNLCGKVVVLCPESHVIATYKPEDWAHSSAEANMHVAVTCYGELLMDRITTRDELFAALDELVQAIDSPEVFTDEMSVQIFWERGRAHWEA